MNLILLEPEEVAADGRARLTGNRARHALEVLGAAPGRTLRVGLADGARGTAVVERTGEGEVELRCAFGAAPPSVPRVDLILAMPRPKVMNRLWPVLAALGVGHIHITNAWKTDRNYFDTHVLQPEVIRRGLQEGLQQARDTRFPEVTIHRRFRELVEEALPTAPPYALRWVAHPAAGQFPFARLAEVPPEGRVLLAVGPEGGWIPDELALLECHGFQTVTWGTRPLRTDTACAVLLGLIHAGLP